ncbi:MAG: HutD family protein [Bosea sp. (in: a-proteobacteria)]|uniref:HutD/Ves family protein n=1 Tax=Bosea sp. (in: a-proteobacteria) TaxID=1871050 RepID=UPI00273713C0|nr:HutD family protein [Bosea sp. (in: a-proteobacteria)]MDP3254376.1 HutD family protein [Bosea sp. (in: a-proteobacteria)]MDP3319384.1 HutD family protein [Bosea sp. (in: a-proteobacteria)]
MTTTRLTPLPPESFRSKPWKNGGGVTHDIADATAPGADPSGWEGMVWRLGRTAIVQPGPFSDLTGYERLQAVIVGSGLVLEGASGEIDLRRPFVPVRYDGGRPLVSRLENGPVEVVNLIVDRALCSADLAVPEPGATIRLTPGIHILYAPGEAVTARCDDAEVTVPGGHALQIDAEAGVSLTVEAGQGLLASIRLR